MKVTDVPLQRTAEVPKPRAPHGLPPLTTFSRLRVFAQPAFSCVHDSLQLVETVSFYGLVEYPNVTGHNYQEIRLKTTLSFYSASKVPSSWGEVLRF